MQTKALSSRVASIAKSAVAAAVLPIFLIYVMIDKPDYKIINASAHIVLPVANFVGDIVSWPIRFIGNAADSVRELYIIRSENDELRAKLAAASARQHECDVAISENQKLSHELDLVRAAPSLAVVANIVLDNSSFHHDTFFINKGANSDIEPNMAVVSMSGELVGIVIDAGGDFARVRSLTDAKSNIPVRISGSEVHGFVAGNGATMPTMEFFSDPEFQPTSGLNLITSGIRGILPDGIYVGELDNETNVKILSPSKISDVMVLKFDDGGRYK